MRQESNRHSIRVPGHDYRLAGAYALTLVTHQRSHIFGEVTCGEMQLNHSGQIAWCEWFKTAVLRPYVQMREDEFVVMPNHVHGVIWISEEADFETEERSWEEQRSAPTGVARGPRPGSLGTIVRAYKAAVTYAVNQACGQRGAPVWQRNYYEHIVRNEQDHLAICDYIQHNPANWDTDLENVL